MAVFESAIPFILKHEGGFVDNPNDHGGATNFGISLRWLISSGALTKHPEMDMNHDGLLDWKDIKAMPQSEAVALYKTAWWEPNKYGDFTNQPLATKVFDMSVNMGPPRAHKLLQRAVQVCGHEALSIDGVLGPGTMAAANQVNPDNLMYVLCHVQADFYRSIVAHNPTQVKFLKGWLLRSSFKGV